MEPDNTLMLGLGLAALLLIAGGVVWIFVRASRLNAAQEREAAAFEREMMAKTRVPTGQTSAKQPPAAVTGQPSDASDETSKEAPPEPPAEEEWMKQAPKVAPPPVAAKPAPTESATEGPSAFETNVIEKLEVAGAFKSIEGPLRCGNPEITGTLISLQNQARFGILRGPFLPRDPALNALMRHLDGLIIEGPEGEALVVGRFQDLLGDLMSL